MAAPFFGGRSFLRRPLLYVRINALDTPLWEDDLAGVMGARPDGILLPKARSGEDVHKLSIALHHAEEHAGAPTGATRIVAIANTLDVMTSDQPYRSRKPLRAALEGIERYSGSQFDPAVVKGFLNMPENIWTDLRQGIEEQSRHAAF